MGSSITCPCRSYSRDEREKAKAQLQGAESKKRRAAHAEPKEVTEPSKRVTRAVAATAGVELVTELHHDTRKSGHG